MSSTEAGIARRRFERYLRGFRRTEAGYTALWTARREMEPLQRQWWLGHGIGRRQPVVATPA